MSASAGVSQAEAADALTEVHSNPEALQRAADSLGVSPEALAVEVAAAAAEQGNPADEQAIDELLELLQAEGPRQQASGSGLRRGRSRSRARD